MPIRAERGEIDEPCRIGSREDGSGRPYVNAHKLALMSATDEIQCREHRSHAQHRPQPMLVHYRHSCSSKTHERSSVFQLGKCKCIETYLKNQAANPTASNSRPNSSAPPPWLRRRPRAAAARKPSLPADAFGDIAAALSSESPCRCHERCEHDLFQPEKHDR